MAMTVHSSRAKATCPRVPEQRSPVEGRTSAAAESGVASCPPTSRRLAVTADLARESRAASHQVADLVSGAYGGLATVPASRWKLLVAVVWLAGIVGDAATTYAMMATGRFEEANPAAASLMEVFGVGGYVLAASGVCLLLAVVATGTARGTYARVVVGTLALLGAGKLWLAFSNALLWSGLS